MRTTTKTIKRGNRNGKTIKKATSSATTAADLLVSTTVATPLVIRVAQPRWVPEGDASGASNTSEAWPAQLSTSAQRQLNKYE